MQTHEVISLPEAELVQALKQMPLAELEQHAKQILKDLGEKNYGGIMKSAMQVLQDGTGSEQAFEKLQSWLRNTLPNEAVMSDIYARLATLLLMIISQKLSAVSSKLGH